MSGPRGCLGPCKWSLAMKQMALWKPPDRADHTFVQIARQDHANAGITDAFDALYFWRSHPSPNSDVGGSRNISYARLAKC